MPTSTIEAERLFSQTPQKEHRIAQPDLIIEVDHGDIYIADDTIIMGYNGCLFKGEPSGWDGQRTRFQAIEKDGIEITKRMPIHPTETDKAVIFRFQAPPQPTQESSSTAPVDRNRFGNAIITPCSIEIVGA